MHVDTLIIGGGIAGLWILDELHRRGHDCRLVERQALGAGQTIWSQGIIHGGLKYTLTGLMNPGAEAIREMPALWRACLAGRREPDLRAAGVRADHCYLWQTASLASRVGMIGARIGLRVAPVLVGPEERPAVLRDCPGVVARLGEQVIDPASVLAALAARHSPRLLRADARTIEVESDRVVVGVAAGGLALTVGARRLVLSAGNGNTALRDVAGLTAGRTQVRPLQMAMLRGPHLPVLNGHCVDGARTRVTITSACDSAGRTVWQIGGELAERGVDMTRRALSAHAAEELSAVLPALDLAGCEWATYDAPRAEGASPAGARPDDAVIVQEGPVLTVFPTKLALAPRLAAMVGDRIGTPRRTAVSPHHGFEAPPVATPPWDADAQWTPHGSL